MTEIPSATEHRPGAMTAMLRGLRRRCPRCGEGALFCGALKLSENCPACGAHLGDIRADDLPAYLTVLLVGHVVVPFLLIAERYDLSTTVELGVSIPVALVMIAVLLPVLKGAAAGLTWALTPVTAD